MPADNEPLEDQFTSENMDNLWLEKQERKKITDLLQNKIHLLQRCINYPAVSPFELGGPKQLELSSLDMMRITLREMVVMADRIHELNQEMRMSKRLAQKLNLHFLALKQEIDNEPKSKQENTNGKP